MAGSSPNSSLSAHFCTSSRSRNISSPALSLLILLMFSSVVTDLSPFLRFELLSSSSQTLRKDCDYSKGRWMRRTSSDNGLLYGEECRFLDSGFRCRKNGRGCYFEEGRKDNGSIMEAFGKSLKTWKSWVLERLDSHKSIMSSSEDTLQCATEMEHGI